MGSTTQAILAVFRLFQLAFATVIAGVIGHYLTFRGSDASSRIVYSVTLAGISMFFALLFLILFRHSFYAFAIDFILFICWIVDFGLMASVSALLLAAGFHTDLVTAQRRLQFGLVCNALGWLLGPTGDRWSTRHLYWQWRLWSMASYSRIQLLGSYSLVHQWLLGKL